MEDVAAVVLAAGKGTRMRSQRPKVLHTIAGRPLLAYVLDAVCQLDCSRTFVVVGCQAQDVQEALGSYPVIWVEQREQLGTAHAVLQVRPLVGEERLTLLVVAGDMPLVRAGTLASLIRAHKRSRVAATVLTAWLADPTGYGRVVRDGKGSPESIVEEPDADDSLRRLHEVNAGVYAFSSPLIFQALSRVQPNNAQQEYYLTDAISILRQMGFGTQAMLAPDEDEVRGVNTAEDLAAVEGILKQRPAPRRGVRPGRTLHLRGSDV